MNTKNQMMTEMAKIETYTFLLKDRSIDKAERAVYAKKFDDIAIIPTFILTPLTYLGGVFYSVKLLPDWAEAATHANPIFYMVNAFRYGLLGTGATDVPLCSAYAVMLGAVIALTWLGLWLLQRGVGLRS